MSCNCFAQKHFRFLLQALPNESLLDSKLIESLFTCSVVLATVPTFQMVVGPQSHTMDIPKRNFTKPADLPKHSLEKVEEATLHPGVWIYSERIVRDRLIMRRARVDRNNYDIRLSVYENQIVVALIGRDQGCFEITNKFRRSKLDAKFFRFGMEHFKYPAIRAQIFLNSQTIYDG
ncbi:hypothetical protein T01_13372 [Trichinella spiralis]|uniref:Uncharacterized protein n=1 Tax=Trichinella spiralis TaxID=6334 RepID=A0A0V1B887_TRISP|nr:hypothetical protein T01_13372 [Trichinella spiralis]